MLSLGFMKKPLDWTFAKNQYYLDNVVGQPDRQRELVCFTELQKYFGPRKPQNFLSIGAGAGDLEILISEQLQVPFGYQEYSPSLSSAFLARMAELGRMAKLLEGNVGKFEDAVLSYTYDLILSVHAWYYISIEPAIFLKLSKLMSAEARVLVVLHRSESMNVALNPIREAPLTITAEDFAAAAKQTKLFQVEIHGWTGFWKTADLIQENSLTQMGSKRLAFSLGKSADDLTLKERQFFARLLQQYQQGPQIRLDYGIVEITRAVGPK